MEENFRPKSCPISILTGSCFDLLNRCIDRFRDGVGRLQLDRIQDPPQMRFDHSPDLDHRLQTAPRDPAQERFPVLLCNSSVGVGPKPIGRLLDPPGSRRFQVQSRQAQKGSFVFVLILGFGPKPVVLGPCQRADSQSTQFAVLCRSDLVQRLSKAGRDMKSVKADLFLCSFKCLPYCVDLGLPYLHRDRSDGLQPVLVLFQPLFERCLLSVFQDLKDRSGIAIRHHRHILVPLLKRRFIDRQVLNGSTLSSGQPPLDRPLHDSRGFVPGDLHLCRDCFNRRDFEPRDRHRLKQGGEPSAWFRPRNVGLANSVFREVNPGNIGLDHGDIPAGIEVSPLSLSMIVGGAFLVTFWTPEPPQWLMGQFQRDLHLFHLEVHLLDAPGSTQAKQLLVKFFVLHDRRISWIPHFFTPTHTKVRSPVQTLGNAFPRVVPRYEQVIPGGRSGWMKIQSLTGEQAIVGSVINYNQSGRVGFGSGHNLHVMSLTTDVVLTIPVFPAR